jgi:hypothetical protein
VPELTRRRSHPDHDSWGIWYDGVRVGAVARRSGNPRDTDAWRWDCGFYPGPDLPQVGATATSFEAAQDAFKTAWSGYLLKCTPTDFEAFRREAAFTAWKYAMWDAGCKMPTQSLDGRSRCFCGAEIGIACEDHIYSTHMGRA